MRLLLKTSLIYLAAMIPVFLVGAWFMGHYLSRTLAHESDDAMWGQRSLAIRLIQATDDPMSLNSEVLRLKPLPPGHVLREKVSFRDSLIIEREMENGEWVTEEEPLRIMSFDLSRDSSAYRVEIISEKLDDHDLYNQLYFIYLIVALAAVVVTLLLVTLLSRRLWSPFYKTLRAIQDLRIADPEQPDFPRTGTSEFRKLNMLLDEMIGKMKRDYRNLKEFSENASHELQTPLAVIRSKLEMLLERSGEDEEQTRLIASALEALKRLSRLNQALLLLSRIENRQFEETEEISLRALCERHAEGVAELARVRELELTTEYKGDHRVRLHPVLADVLCSNLLSNAMRHNRQGGSIHIRVEDNRVRVENTGPAGALDADLIFQRFRGKPGETTSSGLGLAIVREICLQYGIRLAYHFEKELHIFTLEF